MVEQLIPRWQTPEYKARKKEYDKNRYKKTIETFRATITDKDAHNARNRKYYSSTLFAQAKENPRLFLWKICKKRAANKGLEFTILPEDIIMLDFCPITGEKLDVRTNTIANSYSLDRVDNTKGYVPGNVVTLSRKGNLLKKHLTLDTARNVVKYLEEYL